MRFNKNKPTAARFRVTDAPVLVRVRGKLISGSVPCMMSTRPNSARDLSMRNCSGDKTRCEI